MHSLEKSVFLRATFFYLAMVLGISGFAQDHPFSWESDIGICSVMTSSLPKRFCVVMGGMIYDDQQDLTAGKTLCAMVNGRYQSLTIRRIEPAEKPFAEGVAARPALPLIDCADCPDLFPLYTGPCPKIPSGVKVEEGEIGLLPQDLADKLTRRAHAAFLESVTFYSNSPKSNGNFPPEYDQDYLKGNAKPWLFSRVKKFELGKLAVADVKIYFFDRVQREGRPLKRSLQYFSAGWEKVPQDLIEVGAIQFIVLIAGKAKILKENPGFDWIREWYHDLGDIYEPDPIETVSDLDGNGMPEILMDENGYESSGWCLYEVRGDKMLELVSYGCGV